MANILFKSNLNQSGITEGFVTERFTAIKEGKEVVGYRTTHYGTRTLPKAKREVEDKQVKAMVELLENHSKELNDWVITDAKQVNIPDFMQKQHYYEEVQEDTYEEVHEDTYEEQPQVEVPKKRRHREIKLTAKGQKQAHKLMVQMIKENPKLRHKIFRKLNLNPVAFEELLIYLQTEMPEEIKKAIWKLIK